MEEHVVESSAKIVLDLNDKIHVLHVDDDSGLLKITKQCLEMEGPLQVDTALSVEEALMKLEKDKYDIVVSDYQMPGKDGLEFLKALRSKGNAIPFIMFTGKGREEVAIKALNLGANQYVNKLGETETVYVELAHSITELAKARKAEEKQGESEEKFRDLFEKANDGLVFVDLSGRIVDLNQKAAEMAEKRKEDIVGKSFLGLGLVSLNDVPVLVEKLGQQAMGKPTERFEFEIESEKGEKKFIEISSTIIRKNNMPTGSLAIVRDVTERKKAEAALKETKDQLELQIKRMPIGCIVWDKDFKAISWNPAAETIFGYSAKDVIGKHPYDTIVPKEAQPVADKIWQRLLEGDETANSVNDNFTRDGRTITCSWTNTPLKREDNSVIGVLSMVQDITERKKAEEALRESEERSSTISAATFEGIGISEQAKIIDANAQLEKMLGYEPGELIGKSVLDFVAPESRDFVMANMRTGYEGPYEHLAMRKDGSVFPVEIRAKPIRYKGIMARVTAISDITGRKKTEEALRSSEERYRDLFENSKELMVAYDLKGNLTAVNKVAMAYGFARAEHIGRNMLEFVPEEQWPRLREEVKQILQGKCVENEIEIDTPKGKRILEYRSSPIREGEKIVGISGSYRDITERKKAEEALNNSERKYRELFENAYDGILALDLNGRVIEANNAVLRYGYRKEDVVGNSILDLVPRKYHPVLMKDFSQAAQGKPAKNEIEIQTPNGTLMAEYCFSVLTREGNVVGVQVIIRGLEERKQFEKTVKESQQRFRGLFMGNPEAAAYVGPDYRVLEINPRFEELFGYSLEEIRGKHINDVVVQKSKMGEAEALDRKAVEGYVYHNTERRRKDGLLVPVAVSAAPIVVEGKPTGFVAMYKDISDMKNAEKRLETMNEKLQVVGGLTRHDVRNKLGTVTGNAFLLKKKYAEHMDIVDGLKEMEQACTEIVRIFDFAKTYEMLGVEDMTYIDVEKTFGEAVSLFSGLINLNVVNDCHGLTVLADSLLRQLFYNLIDNSLKYGQKITTIKVRYEKTEQDKLEVFYEDDGVGIPVANKRHIFKEGYSTGGSTGYGLYLIKKMMEVYGWTIQETGETGKGVLFTITIPKTNQNGKENYHIV